MGGEDDWLVVLLFDLVGVAIEVGEIQLPDSLELLDLVLGSVDGQFYLVGSPAVDLLYVSSNHWPVASRVSKGYVLELVTKRAKDEDICEGLGSGSVVVNPFLVSLDVVLETLGFSLAPAYLTTEAFLALRIIPQLVPLGLGKPRADIYPRHLPRNHVGQDLAFLCLLVGFWLGK